MTEGTLFLERSAEVLDAPKMTKTGSLQGYACTWAYHEDGIQFVKGSFTKTLAERAGKIPVLVRHEQNGSSVLETVGFVTGGVEDDTGLLIDVTFLGTELAQTVRDQAILGGVRAMSINARSIQHTVTKDIIECKEASLLEVTLTNTPKDPAAEVLLVRDRAAPTPETPPKPVVPDPVTLAVADATRMDADLSLLGVQRNAQG